MKKKLGADLKQRVVRMAVGTMALMAVISLAVDGINGVTPAGAAVNCKAALRGDAEAWSIGEGDGEAGGEAGIDNAYGDWADCLNAQTTAKMSASPKLKERMRRLSNDEANFIGSTYGIASQQAGGGTMWTHQSARSAAPMAEHRARLVNLLLSTAGAKTSPSMKARYDKAVRKVEAYVARIKKPTAADLEFSDAQSWNLEMSTAVKAWTLILPVAGTKKDAAGLEIVEFIAEYAVL